MRILLLRSSTKNYATPPPDTPSGLLYIASALRNAGHEVDMRDLDFEPLGDLAGYDAVGISILSKARQNAFRFIRFIHSRWPRLRIVAGGPHVSSVPNQVLENLPVNAVVVGEGEASAVDAFESNVDGIFTNALLDINAIPFPAFDLVDFSRYYMQIARSNPDWVINGLRLSDLKYSNIVASRGCFGRCTFCNAWKNWGSKVRRRSAENVVDEMEMLNKEYAVSLISFNDNCFPSTKRMGMEICAEIQKRDLKTLWKCDCRGDIIDAELAMEMRNAGCFMVAVGLESASPTILENINKKLDLDKVRESLKMIKNAGMICYPLLMVGNPGESHETIQATVDFLDNIKPHYLSWITGVMILPDTKLCEMAGIDDGFWVCGDDLPYYLKEHTMEELSGFSGMLENIQKDPIPQGLIAS